MFDDVAMFGFLQSCYGKSIFILFYFTFFIINFFFFCNLKLFFFIFALLLKRTIYAKI